MGPAPVTNTLSSGRHACAATRSICSQAFARTAAGSTRTPTEPKAGSTLTAYSGSRATRSAPNRSSSLIPPLAVTAVAAHVELAVAQHGHGSGSGRRTTPTTRSPGPSVTSCDDLAIGPAYAEGDNLEQQLVFAALGLVDVRHPRAFRRPGCDRDREDARGGSPPLPRLKRSLISVRPRLPPALDRCAPRRTCG
jgi:hypothetical protein